MALEVQKKIAEQLSQISPTVAITVVDLVVEKELKKRAEAIVIVLEKLDQAEKAFKKLGPDQKAFNEKGEVINEFFSKTRIDERAKGQKLIERLTGALNKALEKGEMQDVYQLASGKDTNPAGTPETSTSETA